MAGFWQWRSGSFHFETVRSTISIQTAQLSMEIRHQNHNIYDLFLRSMHATHKVIIIFQEESGRKYFESSVPSRRVTTFPPGAVKFTLVHVIARQYYIVSDEQYYLCPTSTCALA